MRDLLEFLVKKIVKNQEAVEIDEVVEEGLIVLNLTVDPDEAGLVIGKGGRTIKGLRSILRVIAIKEGKRIEIKLANVNTNIPQ